MNRQVVNDEVRRIHERDGEVRASVVLEESRPDEAALHPYFEWDDWRAAEQYRLGQSRQIIKSARIKVEGSPQPVALVNVPPEDPKANREGVYVAVTRIAEDRDALQRALGAAAMRLAAAQSSLDLLAKAAEAAGEQGELLVEIASAMTTLARVRETMGETMAQH